MPKHILLTETHHPHLLESLPALPCTWTYLPKPTPDDVIAHLPEAHVWILRGAIPVTEALLAHAPRLEAIIRPGSGTDHIDHLALARRGIQLFTTPYANAAPVAEYVFAVLTLLTRQIWPAALSLQKGHWERRAFLGHEVSTLTVGIIGFGNNGSQTAYRLAAAGARVLAYDKYKGGFGGYGIQEAPLEKLFEEATAVSFHVPLTPQTRDWANREFWEGLPPSALCRQCRPGGDPLPSRSGSRHRNRQSAGGCPGCPSARTAHIPRTGGPQGLRIPSHASACDPHAPHCRPYASERIPLSGGYPHAPPHTLGGPLGLATRAPSHRSAAAPPSPRRASPSPPHPPPEGQPP
jgi:hypothetical protein